MKKFKKILAIVLALTMMAMVAGCGAAPVSSGAKVPASEPASAGPKEIVEITAKVYERGQEFTAGNSTTDNELTRWINSQLEPLGVRVKYIPVPRSGADDKVNLMLSGNEAPDVIMTYDAQRVATYGAQGGLIDLTPYIDRLDSEYVNYNLTGEGSPLSYCNFDGKQYALPRIFVNYGKSHIGYIRADLVEEMNMELPTNMEELVDVLYAMKENYPDIIPYAFSGEDSDTHFANFIRAYTSRADERENYIYDPTYTAFLKEGSKDALKQLNQFYLDGIIASDFAIDVDGSKFDQNVANGKYGFVLDNSQDVLKAYGTVTDEKYEMIAIDVFEDLDGNCATASSMPVSNYVYVPKSAESRIDAVMTFLGWISNFENAKNVEFGIIGKGSDLSDTNVPVLKTEEERKALGIPSSLNDYDMLWRGFSFGPEEEMKGFVKSFPDASERALKAFQDVKSNNFYDDPVITSALNSDQYVPQLQQMIVEMVLKVTAAPEGKFDEVYDLEYKKLLDNHLQEVLNERAAWYDANVANS